MAIPAAHVDVVIGIVIRHGQILVCQRRHDNPNLPGLWEFPGGKREPGETLEACLHRELHEELAIEVCLLAPLRVIDHAYPTVRITLHPFICQHHSGEPQPLACEQCQWVAPTHLSDYAFPPANAELLTELQHWLKANPVRES
jgi:mutator protein MutT